MTKRHESGNRKKAETGLIDLSAQRKRLGGRVEKSVLSVIRHGAYINGPEVARLEHELAAFAGVGHAISCASGTAGLELVLRAWKIKPGDAIFLPAFTFVASASAVACLGAVPFLVDVQPDTFNMDPGSLVDSIDEAKRLGLRPRAVMPVDLFGQLANYSAIEEIAREAGLKVLCDSAQSFGSSLFGKRAGCFGDATVTSFYPAKPLGCYGDGGAVLCRDTELAARLISLREHGKVPDARRYEHIGGNARMDSIQAAILLEKLTIFEEELKERNEVAARYDRMLRSLSPSLHVPTLIPGARSNWAQYTICLKGKLRMRVLPALDDAGISWAIHYNAPIHDQPAYKDVPRPRSGLPVSEMLAEEVVSLPMHAYLGEQAQERVASVLAGALRRAAA